MTSKNPTITLEMLREAGACARGYRLYRQLGLHLQPFPEKIELGGFLPSDFVWLAEMFSLTIEFWNSAEHSWYQEGRETRWEDSTGYWYTWMYDSKGCKIRYEDSDGYWETWWYNTGGRLIRHEDSDGYWETLRYDAEGHLIRRESSTGYWETLRYDPEGRLIFREDWYGVRL
jgi:YD repeat-containing protein